ncbi:MAG: hypothetical protein WC341_00485 [Bacteroidales bacterium]|jgi:hypothetical protein
MKLTDFLIDVGRPVAYYPGLKKITGSTTATIFLCQLIYWKGKGELKNGGIYKTSEELETETGLTYEEQKTARRRLLNIGILSETYARLDHTIVFYISLKRINELWEASWQSLDGEQGNPLLANTAMTDSLNESEITTEITTENKPGVENLNSPEMIESILGIKPKPSLTSKETLTYADKNEKYKNRIKESLETGIENDRQRQLNGKFDCSQYPGDIQETIQLFTDLWQLVPPKSKEPGFADWIKGGRELQKACAEFGHELVKTIYEDWRKDTPFTVSRPGSLVQVAISRAGIIRQASDKTEAILGEINRAERYEWDSSKTEEENLQRIEKMTGTKLTRNQ